MGQMGCEIYCFHLLIADFDLRGVGLGDQPSLDL